MSSPMMTCREVTETVSRSMDERVSLYQRLKVWMHLFMCRYCAQFRQQAHILRRAFRKELTDDIDMGKTLSEDALTRMRCAVEDQLKKSP